MAKNQGLDLIEIAPTRIPVCKIMDMGKFKYDAQKSDLAKETKIVFLKEIKTTSNRNPRL